MGAVLTKAIPIFIPFAGAKTSYFCSTEKMDCVPQASRIVTNSTMYHNVNTTAANSSAVLAKRIVTNSTMYRNMNTTAANSSAVLAKRAANFFERADIQRPTIPFTGWLWLAAFLSIVIAVIADLIWGFKLYRIFQGMERRMKVKGVSKRDMETGRNFEQ